MVLPFWYRLTRVVPEKELLNMCLCVCACVCVVNACFCCVRFRFFPIPSQEIGLGKRLRNDLFCVEWDVKPQLSQSVIYESLYVPLASTPPGMPGTHPPNISGWGGRQREYPPPILLRTFGYSRSILVALRSLSLKPISFGYKTPPIRYSQAGGQSAHKARPPQP